MSNEIRVTGNLGDDGHLKYTPNGSPVLELSIADTPRRRNDRGEWEDAGTTAWFRVSVWGPMAEALANAGLPVKGARATVTGILTPRRYESASGGGTSLDVKATAASIEPKRGTGPSQGGQPADPWTRESAPAPEEPAW